jgi:hypothetical protein
MYYGVGFYALAARGLQFAPYDRFTRNPANLAALLKLEADDNPGEVSAPFSILVMDGTTTRWQTAIRAYVQTFQGSPSGLRIIRS